MEQSQKNKDCIQRKLSAFGEKEDQWTKKKEMHEDKIRALQEALDVKTGQLVQHLNWEKAQNLIQDKDRDRHRNFTRKKLK